MLIVDFMPMSKVNHFYYDLSSYSYYSLSYSFYTPIVSPFARTLSLYFARYILRISLQPSKPSTWIDERMSSPFMVFRFQFLHFSQAQLVMNDMNSETHSCTVSLASLAILAFSGKAFFMILPMLAIGKNLEQLAELLCIVKITYRLLSPPPPSNQIIIFHNKISQLQTKYR